MSAQGLVVGFAGVSGRVVMMTDMGPIDATDDGEELADSNRRNVRITVWRWVATALLIALLLGYFIDDGALGIERRWYLLVGFGMFFVLPDVVLDLFRDSQPDEQRRIKMRRIYVFCAIAYVIFAVATILS